MYPVARATATTRSHACSVTVIQRQIHRTIRNGGTCNWSHLTLYASVNLVNIGSGNGLAPVWRQAIAWTSASLLLIGLLGTNFSEIWIGILPFTFKKICLKMSAAKMAAILARGRWGNTLLCCSRVATTRWFIWWVAMVNLHRMFNKIAIRIPKQTLLWSCIIAIINYNWLSIVVSPMQHKRVQQRLYKTTGILQITFWTLFNYMFTNRYYCIINKLMLTKVPDVTRSEGQQRICYKLHVRQRIFIFRLWMTLPVFIMRTNHSQLFSIPSRLLNLIGARQKCSW